MSQSPNPAELRAAARRCRRLAGGVADGEVSLTLTEMADEFEARARRLEEIGSCEQDPVAA